MIIIDSHVYVPNQQRQSTECNSTEGTGPSLTRGNIL